SLALQHRSAGRKRSRLADCRSNLGWRRAKWRRRMGNVLHRSATWNALCRGRQSLGRSSKAPWYEPFHQFHHRSVLKDRRTEVALPAGPSRCVGLRFRESAGSLRYAASWANRESAGGGEQELLPLYSEP